MNVNEREHKRVYKHFYVGGVLEHRPPIHLYSSAHNFITITSERRTQLQHAAGPVAPEADLGHEKSVTRHQEVRFRGQPSHAFERPAQYRAGDRSCDTDVARSQADDDQGGGYNPGGEGGGGRHLVRGAEAHLYRHVRARRRPALARAFRISLSNYCARDRLLATGCLSPKPER